MSAISEESFKRREPSQRNVIKLKTLRQMMKINKKLLEDTLCELERAEGHERNEALKRFAARCLVDEAEQMELLLGGLLQKLDEMDRRLEMALHRTSYDQLEGSP